MSVNVRIPTILRAYTDGVAELQVTPENETLAAVLDALDAQAPGIGARILDDQGKLRRFVNVYVDDEDVRFAGGLQAPVGENSNVTILPAVAGG